MHKAYAHRLVHMRGVDWAVTNMLRELKRMSRPEKPQQVQKHVTCHKWFDDGWMCHIRGQGIAVADLGKNMVQAIRHADVLYAKLLKEKERRKLCSVKIRMRKWYSYPHVRFSLSAW
jgi:hypothetical protein